MTFGSRIALESAGVVVARETEKRCFARSSSVRRRAISDARRYELI
jgi:hypothetical protein